MRFVLRRLGFFALTLWAALTLNFLLPRMMPGNPALAMIANHKGVVSPQALKALEAQFGLNTHQSLVGQYFRYIGDVATGKFGVSLTTQPGNSVGRIVLDAIPWTLGLVGVTTVLAFVLGTGIGILSAWRRGGRLDSIMPPIFVIMTVVPYFWLGLVLILVFGVKLHWLPYFFTYDFTLTPGLNWAFISNVLEHALLPAFTLLITTIGTWILTMRNTMITTLAEDYVRMARAKGLRGNRIMLDYAARNAILPNLTGFAMSLGFVVGGAILIEEVFNYQGVGYLLLQAVNNNDYPLMQALFLLITAAVLVAILLSEIATAILDPADQGSEVAMAMLPQPGFGAPGGAGAIEASAPVPVPFGGPPAPIGGITGARSVRRMARAITANRKATAGAVLLAIFCFVALFPGLIAHKDPNALIYPRSLGPSAHHLLGTTAFGQDIFAQVIYGTRPVLVIALGVGLGATIIAMLIGVAAAYLGGAWDGGLGLLTDVLLVIPLFPLLIVIASYLHGAGTVVMIAVITFTGWSYTARQLRAQALSMRNRDFLEAARVRGERPMYIIVVEIIPTMTSLLVASFLTNALYAVLFSSSLQFIGLGDPYVISWGTMLYWAENAEAFQTGQALWIIVPGLCIVALGAAFALLNYAFDEIGNPALRPVRSMRGKRVKPAK